MYDKEKIAKILKDIERYFTDLNSFNFDESNIEATEKFYATSMVLFGILNRMIDLAEEIIVKNEWGMPQSYKEYFDVLANNNFIGRELSANLKKLVDYRNLFAHDYYNMQRRGSVKNFGQDFVCERVF